MANYQNLKDAISQVIKENDNQEITGNVLQSALLSIINNLGENMQFAGIAKPTTAPGTVDQNIFYIASETGQYANFGGIELNNEVAILTNKSGSWAKVETGIATAAKVTELEIKTTGLIIAHRFTNESYDVNLGFNYKAGDEVTIEVFTEPSITTKINGNSTTVYEGGNKFPLVTVKDGYGKATYKFTEDGKLTIFGYNSGSLVTTEFNANFRLSISNNNSFSAINEFSGIEQSINEINEELIDIKENIYGISKSFNFSSETYIADFSSIKLKAGVEYFVYAEADIENTFNLLCEKKFNYINDKYYESGKFASIKVSSGKGFVKIKNDTDTDLGRWGFTSSADAQTATINFTIVCGTSLKQSINEINEEIADIKGYKKVNSKVLNISSTVSQGNLQFPITANKKYLLKVDCSEPYNVAVSGNPKLNYIDGEYYEDGQYPHLVIVNGQGSMIISNNTDTNLSNWGFHSTETSALYEGDYTFTLLELSENSESLMSLRQSIDEINIPQINKINGFIRIFHSMGGIGDSLSSGEIVTGSGTDDDPFKYNDRYNFSWLANIARKYGADWRCFSNGGQTAQGWLGRWLSEVTSEENKRSLYFIALGTNDRGLINKGQLVLGTKDSNSNEASFAGYYKKIIESVHAYSEHSIIMCCTTYGKETVLSDINNLIQEISDLYDYCYFINIAQKSTFNLGSEYARGGHFDTIGYVKIADAIEILVNDVLEENKTKLSTWGVDAPN